jgi:hypothetical protein
MPEKGARLDALLKILKFLPRPERWAQLSSAAPAPVWISSPADRPHNANA